MQTVLNVHEGGRCCSDAQLPVVLAQFSGLGVTSGAQGSKILFSVVHSLCLGEVRTDK